MQFTGGHPQILNQARIERVPFNPRDKKHIESFKVFLETGRWGDIQFAVQAPYVSVPHMVLTMFAMDRLKLNAAPLPSQLYASKVGEAAAKAEAEAVELAVAAGQVTKLKKVA